MHLKLPNKIRYRLFCLNTILEDPSTASHFGGTSLGMTLNKGFTLIELLVVVGVLGVLVTAGVASYTNTMKQSRGAAKKSDLEKIRVALEQYRGDNSQYPAATAGSTEANLKSYLISPVAYFTTNSFPKDPQTAQNYFYYYQQNPAGGGVNTYRLCAYIESPKADDPACGVSANCKTSGSTVACNYGLTQP